jgi:hypothetical protein
VGRLTTTREEEMAKLRERYARMQKGEKEPVEKVKEEITVVKTKIKKPRINLKPYLFLIENDVRKVFRLPQKEWKVGGLKFEELKKPLNLDWLEKNGGRLF